MSKKIIQGTNNNDTLTGEGVFVGGGGNDTITPTQGSSHNTFVFNKGDGKDTIVVANDPTVSNTIFFTDITSDMVGYEVSGNNLIVKITGTDDQITLQDYLKNGSNASAYNLRFADGFYIDNFFNDGGFVIDDLVTNGTVGNDKLTGGSINNQIYGGAGDDTIEDMYGYNILEGDEGNDSITGGLGYYNGGKGNDTINVMYDNTNNITSANPLNDPFYGVYLQFALGDGQDVVNNHYVADQGEPDKVSRIIFDKTITTDMVSFNRDNNDLIIIVGNDGDQLTLKDYYSGNANIATDYQLIFEDGTIWSTDGLLGTKPPIVNHAPTVNRDSPFLEQPTIETPAGQPWQLNIPTDIFSDKDGDQLTYIATLLDGSPLPNWMNFDTTTGTISGTPPEGNIIYQVAIDAVDTHGAKTGWFGSSSGIVISVVIPENGKNAIVSGLGDNDTLLSGTAGDDFIVGWEGDNSVQGGDGNDVIYGNGLTTDSMPGMWIGNSSLEGGAGNDTIYGGAGNDLIHGATGDDILFGDDNGSNDAYYGNDTIYGEVGNDFIFDDKGNNYLDGGEGNDTIIGHGTIIGGKGNDSIQLQEDDVAYNGIGSGNVVLFAVGDGQDILSTENTSGRDTIRFGKGITSNMLTLNYDKDANTLLIKIGNSGDQILLTDFDPDDKVGQVKVEFADGTNWNDLSSHITNGDYWNPIYGTSKNDKLQGTAGNDVIYGGAGNDVIIDNQGRNKLYGDAGNDKITGTGTLVGGRGNDTLTAQISGSADVVVFNKGDGQDVVNSRDTAKVKALDVVEFGEGITQDMISYLRKGNNLIVMIGQEGDQITFNNFFTNDQYQTFTKFVFADGSEWQDIRQQGFLQKGSLGKDNLLGTLWDDTIRGSAGNDVITDNEGANYLDGGAGNDRITGRGTLVGGRGNDTITAQVSGSADTVIFNRYDGVDVINSRDTATVKAVDTIAFGEGIEEGDISFLRQANNLIVLIRDEMGMEGDQITLTNFFKGAEYQTFTKFVFTDGTVVEWDDIRQRPFEQLGTAKNDKLLGTDWDDSIYGGAGNDVITDTVGDNYLDGGTGDDKITGKGRIKGGIGNDTINIQVAGSKDTIIFNKGDGQDVINSLDKATKDNKCNDTIEFGQNISLSDLTYQRKGNNLIILVADEGDQITLTNYFKGADYQTINSFQFADGTEVKDIHKELNFTQYGTAKNDNLTGTPWNDSIYAGLGNDVITDNEGHNYLEGGAGNDRITGAGTLNGGIGNDVMTTQVSGSKDVFIFNQGDGQDTINSRDTADVKETDVIEFGTGITKDDIAYLRKGNNLIVLVGDEGDQITLTNFFKRDEYQTVTHFKFKDDGEWTDIRDQIFKQNGTSKKDNLTGTPWNDSIIGGKGNDVITDNEGHNYLEGGEGNDRITGSGTINGGEGNDIITAQVSNSADTFMFNLGDGKDVINSLDKADDKADDVILFGNDVARTAVSYYRKGNNLIITVGQADQITVNNYFKGADYQTIKTLKFSDGTIETLNPNSIGTEPTQVSSLGRSALVAGYDSQTENLINAMAAFAPVSANDSTLAQDKTLDLNSVIIAANVV